MIRLAHALLYAALLGYWTYLLVKPDPVPETLFAGVSWFDPATLKFLLAKALHLGSYAAMALLGGPLVRAGWPRAVLFTLLGVHGALTEVAQYLGNEWYATNRQGSVRDVLIDAAGVCLGAWGLTVLVGWVESSRPTARPAITFRVDDVPPGTEPLATQRLKDSVEALLGTPVEACDSYTATVVVQPGFHSLIAAADLAYNAHYPLVLTPDAIWLTVAQGFARHVANHAEELRPRIVSHAGKLRLQVHRDDFRRGSPENPWAEVWPAFCEQIREHIGTDTHDLMVCDFSTTGPTERAASEVVLMDAVQSYFEFKFSTLCGIPAVTLEGTADDWRRVRGRVDRLAGYGLEWWTNEVGTILDQFVRAAEGDPDRAFWRNMYKQEDRSGGPYADGWLVRLLPYLKTRKFGMASAWQTTERNPLLGTPLVDPRRWGGLTHDQLPASVSAVPFVWEYLGTPFDYQFLAGITAITQDVKTKAIRPRVGWAVRPTPGGPPPSVWD